MKLLRRLIKFLVLPERHYGHDVNNCPGCRREKHRGG